MTHINELDASSQILIISTGHKKSGFLDGLTSIMNQLLYAEKFGFIPVVYFNPWSNDFPDFHRQEIFTQNHWQNYFLSVGKYSYEEIIQLIDSSDHPLTKRNLHHLNNEEIQYLNYGNPDSIYCGNYGFYKNHKKTDTSWLNNQRHKAQAILAQYIKIDPNVKHRAVSQLQGFAENTSMLGVVIDCFENSESDQDLQPNLKLYFNLIDDYIDKNPKCTVLLVSDNLIYTNKLQEKYGSSILVPELDKTSRFRRFDQLLLLSACDYLLKDHSEIGEFVLYFNAKMPFKDIRNQLERYSPYINVLHHIKKEFSLFQKRWNYMVDNRQFSIKTIVKLVFLTNPLAQLCVKSLENHRFSKHTVLRRAILFFDFIELLGETYYPLWCIKYRAAHGDHNIDAGFYRFETAPQKKYFEIRNTWDTNTGFFAYFMMTLTQLKFAETHKLLPVVNFNEPHNHYYEPGYSKNIWENYFEPVAGLDSEALSLKNKQEVTFHDYHYYKKLDVFDEPPETDPLSIKIWFETFRARRAALTKKYIKPKSVITEMIDKYYEEHMQGYDVLGIHIRGTDKEVDQKGKKYQVQQVLVRKITPEEYFPYVDKYLLNHKDARIFVATDQQQYLDCFIERYQDRIISSSALRTSGEDPLFRLETNSKFLRGVEVLCDSLLLSRCDYLIKGWSNVSEAAICFNPAIPVIDIMYLPDLEKIDFNKSQPAVPNDLLLLHESLIEYVN